MFETQRLDTAVTSNPQHLPPSTELLDSDDIPVDNEDQNWIPNVLLMLLKNIWMDRTDWFFGVDMGVYHTTGKNVRVPVVPDGFLSLGVVRRKNNKSRRSYVLWEENNIPPTLALEVVSWTPGGEYDEKKAIYANLGVLYYIIYNPEFWRRDGHQPLEVYQLQDGSYQLQSGEPFWMPEIGLGIGRFPEILPNSQEEVLSWFDQKGDRYLRPEEQAAQANAKAIQAEETATKAQVEAAQAKAEIAQAQVAAIQAQTEIAQAQAAAVRAEQWAAELATKLRELGIDPNSLR
jgi:Uma2 family endonuclease